MVDTGNLELDALAARLRGLKRRAYVRALLLRGEAGWELFHAWALIGVEPPRWKPETWQYENMAFVSCRTSTGGLACLCSADTPESIVLDVYRAAVPRAIGPANWTHRPSYARLEREPLPVPTIDYRISAMPLPNQVVRQVQHEMLVAENAPSFPEPNSAWRAFFDNDFSLSGSGQLPNELATLRFAEDEAWIGNVHVTATKLAATIQGKRVRGTSLELFGEFNRSTRVLTKQGTFNIPLTNGLPRSAWLWLKRGSAWLDYRSIDAQSAWSGDLTRAGVSIERPVEPQANVEALIASGEGPQLEFKERLPGGVKDRKMLKTVAAFATGNGGTMIFGINRDEVSITGLGDEDPNKLRDNLVNMVRAAVTPTPQVNVTHYRIEGKLVLVLDVERGQSPPYGLIPDTGSRDKPDYYVRRGANSYPAQPGELREAVLSSQPLQNNTTPFGPW